MNLPLHRLSQNTTQQKEWNAFLHEGIYANDSPMSYGPRHEIIYIFCSEVLFPFIESFGLTWRVNKRLLTSKVLRLLYELKKRHSIHINDLNENYEYEYYDHYLQVLDSSVWADFWMKWKCISDFGDNAFGYSVQYRIPLVIWNNINIEHSGMFDIVRQELQEIQQHEERIAKGKDDPYLQDILQGNISYDKHFH